MATTIARLIQELECYDPNEPVLFQFIVAEHVPSEMNKIEFEHVADYLERCNFADRLSMMIFDYVEIAKNNLPDVFENVAQNN